MKHSETGEFMKQALALKVQQDLQLRKQFESHPEYIKYGLYFCEEYEHIRTRIFSQQLHASDKLKNHASIINQEKEGPLALDEALKTYYRSLAIFRYIKSKNPDYKKSGIKDYELTYIKYEPKCRTEKSQLDIHLRNIYLNIANIYLSQNRLELCVKACDEALKIDDLNAIALFRKAEAISQNINSNISDYKLIYTQIDKVLIKGENKIQDLNFQTNQNTQLLDKINKISKNENEMYKNMQKMGESKKGFGLKNQNTQPEIIVDRDKTWWKSTKKVFDKIEVKYVQVACVVIFYFFKLVDIFRKSVNGVTENEKKQMTI